MVSKKTRLLAHPRLPILVLCPLALLVIALLLAACSDSATTALSPANSIPTTTTAAPSVVITELPQVEPPATDAPAAPVAQANPQAEVTSGHPTPVITPTSRPTLGPDDWMSLTVVPTVSENARRIYQLGQGLGRNPRAFSKIGDCQVATDFFLVSLDYPAYYNLGEYASLQDTIDWFSGSFSRKSNSSRDAMRAESLFSALFADPKACEPGEGPLACEYRLHNPGFAIISMEQTWSPNIDFEKYTRYMRQAIEYTISQGIVPILTTKADNIEGDHKINRIVAQLAWEYDVPLWNFWAAVQPLPYHGLISNSPSGGADMYHLTVGRYFDFSATEKERSGWTMRNLTALQTLDAVRRGVAQPEP
jgi:hypothetical protein